ncbi:helix-turn-helix domain-containing protein [Citrobacter amalonaticus]|uniref:helix-turn-helix domain-containing protein n=1 Tax=Citrobacter amalonaticus TaxID=35703 RepID=UPI00215CE5DE|nr:helix-turn-helix transcriptional regulator [Citrobacter amalonaticus]MCR9028375.1 helix-turn-helix domain-containing protein [Citrobacter amalonaticus]
MLILTMKYKHNAYNQSTACLLAPCKHFAYNFLMTEKETQAEPLITQRLNELLSSKRVTKAELAKVAGVSPQSVNGWFKRGSISKDAATKLSKQYDVSISWLLGEGKQENELTAEEKRLLEVFNQLPPTERSNMLAAFEMRLQELINFYTKYVNPPSS